MSIPSKNTSMSILYLKVDEVLSKDSAEEISDGKTPGPMTEINFWEAKCINLESLFEQVRI